MLNRYLETAAGDTLSFRIVLRDGASPVDVSAMSFSGGVRRQGGTVNLVDFSFELVNGVIGVVRVTLTPEQTSMLRSASDILEWHVKMNRDGHIKTLGYGALKVLPL
jgi:hypothetical protein